MSCLRTVFACAALGLTAPGCANLMTSRAIDSFAAGLENYDSEILRKNASERFARQALRLPEAADDLKVLNLPHGKLTVLKVEEVSDSMRHVTVQIGDTDESNETLEYHLTRPDGQRRWVVDDVFVTRRGTGRGTPVTKSVTEQMDLLLSVREFVAAWTTGSRDEVLDIAAPELHDALAELPPSYLQQVAAGVVDGLNGRALRPEARINDGRAVVMLPRSRGRLIISLAQIDEQWKIADVVTESDDKKTTSSTRTQALAMSTVVRFLNAYSAGDRGGLEAAASPAFYKSALVAADLSTVPIPVVGLLAAKFEYNRHPETGTGDRIDVVIPHAKTSYMLSVVGTSSDAATDATAPRFTIEEVTLYEEGTAQVKRLSSVFTAHAVMEVFAESLANRDRARLLALSTPEFGDRAWASANDLVLQAIPLPEIEAAPPRVVATVFRGPMAEITVTQGSSALTYVLRSSRGRMLVDDVLLPVADRPSSLKATLEVLVPLYSFALGAYNHDIPLLRQTSGQALTRMVWSHTSDVPDVGLPVADYLTLPIRTIRMTGDRSVVEASDGIRRAKVTLGREDQRVVVQEVILIAGSKPDQQLDLMQALRNVLSTRNTYAGGAIDIPRGRVMQASGVIQASGESL